MNKEIKKQVSRVSQPRCFALGFRESVLQGYGCSADGSAISGRKWEEEDDDLAVAFVSRFWWFGLGFRESTLHCCGSGADRSVT